jgi:hypothetical protein
LLDDQFTCRLVRSDQPAGTTVALMIATDEELKIASDAWKLAP